jgi:hypothetical protein
MEEYFDSFYYSNKNIFAPNRLWEIIDKDQNARLIAFDNNPDQSPKPYFYSKKQFIDYVNKQEDHQINKKYMKPKIMHPIISFDRYAFQIDLTFYNQWEGLKANKKK